MLPNWLYGKSKSKLASILGGGGGAPADYDQVKAQVTQNTEDILLLSDALDDKAALTQLSNPNILHNPIFSVNQRGFTTTSTDNTFIADRWKCNANGGTFVITRNSDGTYTFDNTNNSNDLIVQQKRTSATAKDLNGKKLTASIEFSDGTIKSGTATFTSDANVTYLDETDVFNLAAWPTTNNTFFLLIVKPGASITVRALKLEVGEVSTLAMDPRPEYALELAKCQRYFQNILNTDASNNRLIAIAYAVSTTSARILITLPDHMRTNAPAFTKSGDFVLQPVAGGTAIDVSSVASLGLMETYINIKADVASGLTAGAVYFFQAKPNAALNIDAEL